MDAPTKRKVAILGGGVGAITAAFELTSPDNPARDEYEVTVYQMGWRLGGKGASGRNANFHQRIEEHGLHIWMGWYHNAFRTIKECYSELRRDEAKPLARWHDAFKPHSLVTLMDRHGSQWKRWDIAFPRTTDEPGNEYASLLGQLRMLLGWMRAARSALGANRAHGPEFLYRVFGVRSLVGLARIGMPGVLGFLRSIGSDRRVSPSRCAKIRAVSAQIRSRVHTAIDAGAFDSDDTLRRLTEVLAILFTVIIGLIDEGIATGTHTFNELDELELREFLRKHGCHAAALECAFLRCYYNLALAYRGGDSTDPASENAAAGVAINIILRACFGYRGAFMWEMQSGMGDTIFAPYYEVLKKRGVTFNFFHRVRALEPSLDGLRIERIRIERQVDLRAERYDPLIDVHGLPCWPAAPLYDQLLRGDELRVGADGRGYNLESNDGDWPSAAHITLEAGRDFDTAILGIPAMAQTICDSLSQRSEAWKSMISGVETVATQACQLWFRPPVDAMGWKTPPSDDNNTRRILGAYAQPFHSWADFSHLADSEDWPSESRPQAVAYLLGTIPERDAASAKEVTVDNNSVYVQRSTNEWLSENAHALWPHFASGDELSWDLLFDHRDAQGEARLAAQYHRANTEGSERYVQHTARTTKYRMKPGKSGFDNLVLAGDWTDTGICGGCVETATMSGMQASRAISGYPKTVIGESSGPR